MGRNDTLLVVAFEIPSNSGITDLRLIIIVGRKVMEFSGAIVDIILPSLSCWFGVQLNFEFEIID